MKNTQMFIEEFVKAIPTLQILYDEHIDYYEELIPHVFMGDLTRYVIKLFQCMKFDDQKKNELEEILKYLELGMSRKDEDIQELISISFLENLDVTDASLRLLEKKFGKNLKGALKIIRET